MARKKDGDGDPGPGAQALLDAELAKLEAAKEELTAAVDAEAELAEAAASALTRADAVSLVGESGVATLESAGDRETAVARLTDELASRRTPYRAWAQHNVDAHGAHATSPVDPAAEHGARHPGCTWRPR